MRWERDRSGLLLPRRPGLCSLFGATALCGFGAGGSSVPQPLWSQTDKDADITVSGGDLIATAAGAGSVISTTAKATGKFYIEATAGTGATANQWRFGIGTASILLSDGVGKTAASWAIQGGGNKITNDSASAYATANSGSDNMMLALDAAAGAVWIGREGTWLASGDPAAGTNAMFTGLSGPFYLAFGSAGSTREITLKEYASYLYSPPAGFTKGW